MNAIVILHLHNRVFDLDRRLNEDPKNEDEEVVALLDGVVTQIPTASRTTPQDLECGHDFRSKGS